MLGLSLSITSISVLGRLLGSTAFFVALSSVTGDRELTLSAAQSGRISAIVGDGEITLEASMPGTFKLWPTAEGAGGPNELTQVGATSGAVTSATFSGLNNGVEYAGEFSADALMIDGLVPAAVVDVATDDAGFDWDIDGDGTITIDGVVYNIHSSDIENKSPHFFADTPVAHLDVDGSGGITAGDTLMAGDTPYVYNASGVNPADTETFEWVRSGVVVGTDRSYQVQELDVLSGLTVRSSVTNGFGTSSRDTTAIEPQEYIYQPILNNQAGVLSPHWGANVTGEDNLLIATTIQYVTEGKVTLVDGTESKLALKIGTGKSLTVTVKDVGGSSNLFTGVIAIPQITAGSVVSAFLSVIRGVSAQMVVYVDGVQAGSIVKGSAPSELIYAAENVEFFMDGGRKDNTNYKIHSLRIWSGAGRGNVDLLSDDFAGQFMREDGLPVNPLIAEQAYGRPYVELPLDADDLNAGVNSGTGGAFTIDGTFTHESSEVDESSQGGS